MLRRLISNGRKGRYQSSLSDGSSSAYSALEPFQDATIQETNQQPQSEENLSLDDNTASTKEDTTKNNKTRKAWLSIKSKLTVATEKWRQRQDVEDEEAYDGEEVENSPRKLHERILWSSRKQKVEEDSEIFIQDNIDDPDQPISSLSSSQTTASKDSLESSSSANGKTFSTLTLSTTASQATSAMPFQGPLQRSVINNNTNKKVSFSTANRVYEINRRTVGFSTATVHYHSLILGDSPSVTCGAPLALGKETQEPEIIDLSEPQPHEMDNNDDDESHEDANVEIVKMISYDDTVMLSDDEQSQDSQDERTKFRTDWTRHGSARPLQIPPFVRTQMLLDAGIPEKEIERTIVFLNLEREKKSIEDLSCPDQNEYHILRLWRHRDSKNCYFVD